MDVHGPGARRELGRGALWTGFLLAIDRVSLRSIAGVVACLFVGGLASSGAVGARAAPTSQVRAVSAAPEPTPTLIDVLRAADALHKAELLPGRVSAPVAAEPTPALIDVLLAADALKRVGLLPSPTAPGPAWTQPASAQGARLDVVFFGDSVTAGAGASDADRGFVSILRERLSAESRLGSSQVVVSAFGGLRGDLENVRAVLRKKPGVVVVEVGAHSAVEDQVTPMATFRSVYGLILDCLQGTGAVVVVGTAPWLHWARNDLTYARAAAISEVIGEEAAKRGVPLADIWDAMKDREAYISPDGMHPNDSGHELIAGLYWRQIQRQMSMPRYIRASPCGFYPT